MAGHTDWNLAFSLNARKAAWLIERLRADVAPHVSTGAGVRILDLGCGCGEETFLLAELFPQAEVIGLDISAPNIAQGEHEALRRGLSKRVWFVCADYRSAAFPREHFDLVVADGVLHLIPPGEPDVMTKIAAELRPGGQFAFGIPRISPFNHALWLVRSLLRRLRAKWTDRLVLSVARLLHRGEVCEEYLWERVHYMYITPTLWGSRTLEARLAGDLGLTSECLRPYPHASLGQFQHGFWVYSKPGGEYPATSKAA